MAALRVNIFGTFERRRVPRIDVLAEGLTANGHVVDFCNEPLPLSPDERLAVLKRPWTLHRLVIPLMACWWRLRQRARKLPKPDVVIVGYMAHFDVHLAKVLFPRSVIALDQLVFAGDTAADRGGTPFVQRLLRLTDAAAIRASSLVLVDTEEHLQLIPEKYRGGGLVVAVGASSRWFASRRMHKSQSKPLRVIFFGIFTPLQGTKVIAGAIAQVMAGGTAVTFTMVGTGQDYSAVRSMLDKVPDVSWIDWVEPDDLPGIVAANDVCLGIFGTSAKAYRVVPNKVYQACAAGRAIITSDTPPQRRVLGDAVLFVPAGDSAALALALKRLANDPDLTTSLQFSAAQRAKDFFLPRQVTAELASRLETVSP